MQKDELSSNNAHDKSQVREMVFTVSRNGIVHKRMLFPMLPGNLSVHQLKNSYAQRLSILGVILSLLK